MEKKDPVNYRRLAVIVGGAVFSLWLIGGLIPFKLYSGMAERGQLGDLFGAVNALFSGLAFAGVIIAILLQRQELELQRHELESTREELKRTAEAQEKSQKALSEQVEMQLLTARLQALAALLSHRTASEGRNSYADAALKMSGRDAESYATQIEQLIKHLSTFK